MCSNGTDAWGEQEYCGWREKTSGAESGGPATLQAWEEKGLALMSEKVRPGRWEKSYESVCISEVKGEGVLSKKEE